MNALDTIKAIAHPLRWEIVRVLADGDEWCPTELADTIDHPRASLGNVSYHVRMLDQAGLIRLTHTEPVRGTVRHYYAMQPKARSVVVALEELVR